MSNKADDGKRYNVYVRAEYSGTNGRKRIYEEEISEVVADSKEEVRMTLLGYGYNVDKIIGWGV